MSMLSQLAQRIRSLPNIETERTQIRIAQSASSVAESVSTGLAIALKEAPYIDSLTHGDTLTLVTDLISSSISQAKSIKKIIQREKFGPEKKISEYLDNLKNKQLTFESKKTKTWAKVQEEIQTTQTILDIAVSLQLESVTHLRSAIMKFNNSTFRPPSNTEDVDCVIAARIECKNAIANSGLTGNVKLILEGAINNNGDPKLLLEADVQTFLKDHPMLWNSLKLKLA